MCRHRHMYLSSYLLSCHNQNEAEWVATVTTIRVSNFPSIRQVQWGRMKTRWKNNAVPHDYPKINNTELYVLKVWSHKCHFTHVSDPPDPKKTNLISNSKMSSSLPACVMIKWNKYRLQCFLRTWHTRCLNWTDVHTNSNSCLAEFKDRWHFQFRSLLHLLTVWELAKWPCNMHARSHIWT